MEKRKLIDKTAGSDKGEQELSAEEINFRQLAETIPHFVWSARADGVSDYYNSRFLNYLGKTLDEMRGWTWAETLHPDDRQRCIDNWIAAFTTGSNYYDEYRIRRGSDGGYLWHEGRATPLRDEEGNVVRWFGTCTEIEERKQTEQLLRDSECRYRELVENANSAIVRWSADGKLTFINEYAQRFFGYTADEVIGRHVNFLLPDKEMSGTDLSTLVQDIVSHPERYTSNVNENICRDGRRVWMAWTNKPIFGPDGQLKETLGVGTDLTERRQAETALIENEERLRLALDSAYVISFEWDILRNEVHRTISHEPALPATSDRHPETFEDVLALVHPDDREQFKANVATALASESGEYESEHRFVRPNGEPVWVYERGRVKRNEAGQPVRLIGLAQDVSNRRQTEEALRDSEELYRAIGESIDYGVWVCDPTGRNTYASPSFLKLVGLTQEQCSDFGWSNVLHPDDAEATMAAWKECALTGSLWSIEHRFRGVDGEWHPILARGVPVRDNRGRVKFWAGINLDISDLKQTEKALEEAKSAAEKANRAKSDFLANMSHDIRTPMTIFLMAIEQLQQINTDPASGKLLELANRSAKALRELVDDILDISQIEAGRVKLLEEPIELRSCVHEVVEMFVLSAQEKSLCLTEAVAPEVPAIIVADQGRFKQVLINLLGNALKFTNQGGVDVTVGLTGDTLMFTVADTGIGIPEDKQGQLFRSFSQVDNTFQRQYVGSGLGLAICKGLVELMGGSISVHSREDGGSIFTFTLPLKTVTEKPALNGTSVGDLGSDPGRPARILLVDDDPMIREIVSIALTHHGWQVETAANGCEAFELWKTGMFDIILMDLQMPGVNGLEAVRSIRAAESTTGGHIAIIGFTAHTSEHVSARCIKAGMDHVLYKPLHFDELSEAINRSLKKRLQS